MKIWTAKHFDYPMQPFFLPSFKWETPSDHGATFQPKFIPLSFFMEYDTV